MLERNGGAPYSSNAVIIISETDGCLFKLEAMYISSSTSFLKGVDLPHAP